MKAKLDRERRIRERNAREDRWERNRARRNLLTDEAAFRVIRKVLADAGDPRRIFLGQPPVPKRGEEVLEVTRSHHSKTRPCSVTRWRRFEIPGLGRGRSGRGDLANGRSWEATIIEVRRAIDEKRAGADWGTA